MISASNPRFKKEVVSGNESNNLQFDRGHRGVPPEGILWSNWGRPEKGEYEHSNKERKK